VTLQGHAATLVKHPRSGDEKSDTLRRDVPLLRTAAPFLTGESIAAAPMGDAHAALAAPAEHSRQRARSLPRNPMSTHERERIEADRLARAERRCADPRPTCASCGLPITQPHGSDADCVRALRAEIDMLRALLTPRSLLTPSTRG
jgi:hypothetical protein